MNERIKELSNQASFETSTSKFAHMTFKERFAELIIRECADIIDEHEDSRPYDTFGIMLKKHFGVEE